MPLSMTRTVAVLITVTIVVLGYTLYQDQQRSERVEISIGGTGLSVENN
ncbi:MAG: hypothetical protein R3D02_10300 [Hyphomicrobiales bacterium]